METITMSQNGRESLRYEGSCATCVFSDDGRGVQADGLMRDAMYRIKNLANSL